MRGRPKIATKQDVYNVCNSCDPWLASGLLREHRALISEAEFQRLKKYLATAKARITLEKNAKKRRWKRLHDLEKEVSALMAAIAGKESELRLLHNALFSAKQERKELLKGGI